MYCTRYLAPVLTRARARARWCMYLVGKGPSARKYEVMENDALNVRIGKHRTFLHSLLALFVPRRRCRFIDIYDSASGEVMRMHFAPDRDSTNFPVFAAIYIRTCLVDRTFFERDA